MNDLQTIDNELGSAALPRVEEPTGLAGVAEPSQYVQAVQRTETPGSDPVSAMAGACRHAVGDAVSRRTMDAAARWLRNLKGPTIKWPEVNHHYDVRGFQHHFTDDIDKALLGHFLNAMAAAGASQREVSRLIEWNMREFDPNKFTTSAADRSEIARLEKFMRENRSAWFKDETKQARYRELISKT